MSPGPTARRLIVNADDFGLTEGVSRGILRAHRLGLVTSTTVLASLSRQAELDAEAAAARGLGLGLHLNLTWGRPVSPAETVPSLVDAEGRFGRDQAPSGERARPDDVRREGEAQIEAFTRRFGRAPTHLDSHHHVHRLPRVVDAVVGVALAARLPVRSQDAGLPRRPPPQRHRHDGPLRGRSGGRAVLDGRAPSEPARDLPVGLTELMCHPGLFEEDLAYSRYGRQREVELAALCDAKARATIERLGIRLCHFGARDAAG